MSGPDPRPDAVGRAAAWLYAHRDQYTRDALDDRLREQGYTEPEISEAHLHMWDAAPDEGRRRDLRATAAIILIVAFLGAWALISVPLLLADTDGHGFAAAAAGILAVVLGAIGLPALIFVADNRALKRGTLGTLVAILALPFALLVVVAGMCVSVTRGMTL